jgi:PAS domain S-box-containing protein
MVIEGVQIQVSRPARRRLALVYFGLRLLALGIFIAFATLAGRDFFVIENGVEEATEAAAIRLADIAARDPDGLRAPGVDVVLENARTGVAATLTFDRAPSRFEVLAADGAVLSASGETSGWPSYTHDNRVVVAGEVVAVVRGTHSLRPGMPFLLAFGTFFLVAMVGGFFFQVKAQARVVAGTEEHAAELEKVARERNKDLATANAHLTLMLEATSDGFALFDQQERLVLWNRSFARLNAEVAEGLREGITIEQMTQAMARQLPRLSAEQVAAWSAARRRGLATVGVHQSSYTTAAGLTLQTHERRTDDGRTVVTLSDVTDLKNKERALAKSEAQMRMVSDALPVMVAVVRADGGVLYANATCAEMVGTPSDRIVGTKWPSYLSPGDIATIGPAMERAFRGEHVRDEVTIDLGGKRRTIMIRVVPHERRGRIEAVFFFGLEVTEELLLEAQLQQAQKMETLGQLTGGIAHDFNNLLTVVLGNLDLADEFMPEDAAARRPVDAARRGAERAATLTQRLLAFSRRQVLRPKHVAINDLVSGFADLLRSSLGEQVEVALDLEHGLPLASIDEGQLENAILNLSLNARDAMAGNGRITIATGEEVVRERRHLGGEDWLECGHYATLSVTDTGAGMDEKTRVRVFEPFFTTKDTGKGSGLGLSMVYGFVRQSGGGVRVDSVPGKGTQVTLYLPCADNEEKALPVSDEGDRDIPAGTEHLLVIEDDPDVRENLTQSLRGLGYRITAAADGDTAIDLLRTDNGFDLIVSDVVLPGAVDGGLIVKAARDLGCDVPALFVTGYAPVQQRNSLRHERIEILLKPFSRRDLARQVRALLDGETPRTRRENASMPTVSYADA